MIILELKKMYKKKLIETNSTVVFAFKWQIQLGEHIGHASGLIFPILEHGIGFLYVYPLIKIGRSLQIEVTRLRWQHGFEIPVATG
jgi:hypothetical protein